MNSIVSSLLLILYVSLILLIILLLIIILLSSISIKATLLLYLTNCICEFISPNLYSLSKLIVILLLVLSKLLLISVIKSGSWLKLFKIILFVMLSPEPID